MYCLSVNIILIILFYQCLTTYTFQHGLGSRLSHASRGTIPSPEVNITKSDDDSVKNTIERIKNNIDDLNNDEIKARMKILQEFKDSPDCFIYLPTGGRYFMPIPITTTKPPKIIRPRKDGVMTFKHNSRIKLSCTYEPFVRPIQNISEVTVKCLNGSLVEYNDKVYEFDLFKCNTVPKPTLRKTQTSCQESSNNKILEVGFATSDAFLVTYKICFDMKAKNPLYSWYHVSAPHLQPYDKLFMKPQLNYTDVFGDIKPPLQYEAQKLTVETIIDSKALSSWYVKDDGDTRRVLHAGLLTPQGAFSYTFEQYSTYYYENSAPSWGMFNRGIWKDVETLIRLKLSHSKNRHMLVTGTHGIMILHDVHRMTHPFYLSLPSEMAVPQYIWLMDHNLDTDEGMVFIGRNNPYDALRAKSKFTICPAIPCPGNLIRKRDYSRDLLYCCTKKTFEMAYGNIDHVAYKPFY